MKLYDPKYRQGVQEFEVDLASDLIAVLTSIVAAHAGCHARGTGIRFDQGVVVFNSRGAPVANIVTKWNGKEDKAATTEARDPADRRNISPEYLAAVQRALVRKKDKTEPILLAKVLFTNDQIGVVGRDGLKRVISNPHVGGANVETLEDFIIANWFPNWFDETP